MKSQPSDERGIWTSASAAEADSLCAGRHLAQRGLPEGEKSADADSGTRIHSVLEGNGDEVGLSFDEYETKTKCSEIEGALLDATFSGIKPTKIIREQRLWIDFDRIWHSGKADAIAIIGDTALIWDYKTGRNEATESPRNLQLRDLAVLVAVNYNVRIIHAAIIQPWATMTPEVCTYSKTDLVLALTEMENRVLASNDPKSARTPGDKQCKYCRARSTCPEFMAVSEAVITDGVSPELVANSIKTIASDKLGKFLALVRLAEETATDEVRRRLDAGESVQGWVIKPGRETEKITDAQTVFNRALAAGIPQDKFVSDCITVGKTALKTALKTATGAKGKALDAQLETLLDGATETKVSSPILTKL